MTTNMNIRPEVLNAVCNFGGVVYNNSVDEKQILSTLQGDNKKFVVTPGSVSSSENYLVYFLNNQGNLKQTTFSMDSKAGRWCHGNGTNISVIDPKLVLQHIQEHAEFPGYKLVL